MKQRTKLFSINWQNAKYLQVDFLVDCLVVMSYNFLLKVLIRKYENSKKYRAWEQEITKNYATKLGPVQVIDRLGNV